MLEIVHILNGDHGLRLIICRIIILATIIGSIRYKTTAIDFSRRRKFKLLLRIICLVWRNLHLVIVPPRLAIKRRMTETAILLVSCIVYLFLKGTCAALVGKYHR